MNEHPVAVRAFALAKSLGSTATTTRGVARFLHWHKKPQRIFGAEKSPDSRKKKASAYIAAEAARKADPEAKRAIHDPEFRKAYMFRLKRRNEQARRTRATTLRGITAAADSRPDRVKEVNEIARLRSIVYGKPISAEDVPKTTSGVLMRVDVQLARRYGAKVIMVGKEAALYSTRRSSHGIHYNAVPSSHNYHKGRREGYERAEHKNYVRSFAVIDSRDDRTVHYALHKTEVSVTLPNGFRWDVDANGLRAVNGADDYHPSANELLNMARLRARGLSLEAACNPVVNAVWRNANKRRDIEAAAARLKASMTAEKADAEGVWVCLADSIRAGNCHAGSMAFAARHDIDPSKHYRATELLDIANGDAPRVRLAVTAARLRHQKEVERGYAVLAEHAVNQ